MIGLHAVTPEGSNIHQFLGLDVLIPSDSLNFFTVLCTVDVEGTGFFCNFALGCIFFSD